MRAETKLLEGSGDLVTPEQGDFANRLWRLEQRSNDMFARLDKIDARVEPIAQRQEERNWRTAELERRVMELERKPASPSMLSLEHPLVKTVILALLAAVIGLATGTFLDVGGVK